MAMMMTTHMMMTMMMLALDQAAKTMTMTMTVKKEMHSAEIRMSGGLDLQQLPFLSLRLMPPRRAAAASGCQRSLSPEIPWSSTMIHRRKWTSKAGQGDHGLMNRRP
jgi:hypothetical protein